MKKGVSGDEKDTGNGRMKCGGKVVDEQVEWKGEKVLFTAVRVDRGELEPPTKTGFGDVSTGNLLLNPSVSRHRNERDRVKCFRPSTSLKIC